MVSWNSCLHALDAAINFFSSNIFLFTSSLIFPVKRNKHKSVVIFSDFSSQIQFLQLKIFFNLRLNHSKLLFYFFVSECQVARRWRWQISSNFERMDYPRRKFGRYSAKLFKLFRISFSQVKIQFYVLYKIISLAFLIHLPIKIFFIGQLIPSLFIINS